MKSTFKNFFLKIIIDLFIIIDEEKQYFEHLL